MPSPADDLLWRPSDSYLRGYSDARADLGRCKRRAIILSAVCCVVAFSSGGYAFYERGARPHQTIVIYQNAPAK